MGMNDLVLAHNLAGTYPQGWDNFIGQEPVKRQLRVAATSARMRGAAMPHVLLAAGEQGIGKTTLALLTAAELGTGLRIVTGRIGVDQARIALSGMDHGDVLFIDEIHQLVSRGKANAEWLLHLLQDGVLMGPFGPEAQPEITVIGATTDVGRLPETITARFPLQPQITPYSEDEAALIAISMAEQIILQPLPWPSTEDFRRIARAGAGNPRTIGSILANLRDLVLVDPDVHDGERYDLTEALGWLGLSPDGLTASARDYLWVLFREFGGTAGEKAISERLGEPGGVRHIETALLKRGYVARTRRGRVLTKDGIQRAKEEADARAA